MAPKFGRNIVLEAIETLRRRSLLERVDGGAMFALPSMVLDYLTVGLAETAGDRIEHRQQAERFDRPLQNP
jgi:DNA-binding FadR family transcriptional regulator